jgi:glycosyltransferase involved in cell wall biosynthesis
MTRRRILACVFSCCPPDTPGFSGGEDVLGWNLLKQIGRSHDVWALTQTENRRSIEQQATRSELEGITFCYVDLPRWSRLLLKFQGTHQFYAYIWQVQAYFAARRLHKQHKFDLFHHITYANDWMPSFIGALLPVKYIRGPGGGAHRTPKGFESEYSFRGRIWERVRSVSQWLFRHDPTFRRGQARANALLLCNKESIAQVPSQWSAKTHSFPVNGISSSDIAEGVNSRTNADKFQLLTAGSLIRVKGLGLAIKAFEQFNKRHGDSEFVIVGSGPEERHLRSLVRKRNLEGKVRFIPAMPRHLLLSEMSGCDVFLFPSLRDGGGAVVIEAMAMGKPVVCLDTGGPAMHVNSECGIKVPVDSPAQAVIAMAEAMDDLYDDPSLKMRQGEEAVKRAREFYLWDRLGERLMGIYDQVLSSGRNE